MIATWENYQILPVIFSSYPTVISLFAGATFSPHAANLVKPLEYTGRSDDVLKYITPYFTRLVLGVQLVLAGVQLPSRYLITE